MTSYQTEVGKVSPGVRRFFERTFSKNEFVIPDRILERLGDSPTMIVSTHRSHADYFLLGSTLYHMGLKDVRYAAGDNLTKLPYLGPRFQGWGAFPVERHRARDRSYITKLADQFAGMLLNKQNVILFPEGGRSYKGDLMSINQVVLGGAVLAQARDQSRDVKLLPCAISYEQLPELPYFDILQKGRTMRKPGNSWLTRRLGDLLYFGPDLWAFTKLLFASRFGRSYGSLYVDFGEPFSLRSCVDLEANRNPTATEEFWAHRASAQKLADVVRDKLFGLYRLLPMHVVAHALKDVAALPRTELQRKSVNIVRHCAAQGRNLTTMKNFTEAGVVDEGIRQLKLRRAVSVRGGVVTVRKRSIVNYYAAAIE